VTSRLSVGLAWARSTKKGTRLLSNLVWARLSSLERDSLVVSGFGKFWASAGVFQLSLFNFVYSPFAQSSSFFPKIMKLTQV